jgi:hypothetical protein
MAMHVPHKCTNLPINYRVLHENYYGKMSAFSIAIDIHVTVGYPLLVQQVCLYMINANS